MAALPLASAHAQARQTVAQRLAEDLTWSQAQRETRFAHMDRIFPVNRIHPRGGPPLPAGTPLRVELATGESLQQWMERDRIAGVLVIQRGRARMRQYGLHATANTAWTSFSMTKSVTVTLVGYALRDGLIRNTEDPVTNYLPELRGSAYDGVTVRQLAAMTSGVHWVEDYTTPDSDNVKLYATPAGGGRDPVIEYMRKLPRETAPGTEFVYKTGETDLLGVLVRRAVGSSLSAYAQRTLWRDMGARSNAFWIADAGKEFGGSGLSATLEDFGRFGEWIRKHRGKASAALPADSSRSPSSSSPLRASPATATLNGWLAEATRPAADSGHYGLGWWTYPDGSFAALGIFGQSILVDPARELVVVILGAWPRATSPELVADREVVWSAVRNAVDRTAAGTRPGTAP